MRRDFTCLYERDEDTEDGVARNHARSLQGGDRKRKHGNAGGWRHRDEAREARKAAAAAAAAQKKAESKVWSDVHVKRLGEALQDTGMMAGLLIHSAPLSKLQGEGEVMPMSKAQEQRLRNQATGVRWWLKELDHHPQKLFWTMLISARAT